VAPTWAFCRVVVATKSVPGSIARIDSSAPTRVPTASTTATPKLTVAG
jgi:hypothetical protein